MYVTNKKANAVIDQVISEEMQLLSAYEKMSSSISVRISAVRGYIISGDASYKDEFKAYTDIGIENENIIRSL